MYRCILVSLMLTFVAISCATMDSSWNKARMKDTPESYFAFIEKYPGSPYAEQAKTAGLLRACSIGNTAAVTKLLEMNTPVNVVDEQGNTPLMIAAEGGHAVIVKLLLDKGANPRLKNRDGITAFHKASARKHEEIEELLLHSVAVICTTNLYRVVDGNGEIIVGEGSGCPADASPELVQEHERSVNEAMRKMKDNPGLATMKVTNSRAITE